MTIECGICEVRKDETCFSKGRRQCKDCLKRYHIELRARQNHTPEFREHVKELYRKYYKANRARYIERAVKSQRAYPEKVKARNSLNYLLKIGRITRLPCIVCNDERSHGHHENYKRYRDVLWLCALHHNARHKEIREGVTLTEGFLSVYVRTAPEP